MASSDWWPEANRQYIDRSCDCRSYHSDRCIFDLLSEVQLRFTLTDGDCFRLCSDPRGRFHCRTP